MLIRFLRWIFHKIGTGTLFSISLLLIAVSSAVFGLGDVIRGLDSGFLFRLVLIAILLSWSLARSKIPAWSAVVFLILAGIFYLIIDLADLSGPLIAFFKATVYLGWEYANRTVESPIDFTNFNLAYSEVYYGVAAVIKSFWDWIMSMVDGLPLFDEIAISLVWGFAVWISAAWGGWIMRRQNRPVLSVLPVGILLTTTLAYTWSRTVSLIPMLFSTLLMMALVNYRLSEGEWASTRMDYPEDLPKEFGLASFVIVLGIVALATFLPTISISKIVETVQQFTKPQIEEAEPVFQSFGLNQSSLSREDIGRALRAGFPRGHLMGSGPELAENVVMTVNISAGIPKNTERELNLPLYWRSLTYDDYSGFGWRSTDIILRSYKEGQRVISTDSPFYRVIQQDYRMAMGETQFLYAAGEILSADYNFKIAYRPTPRYTEVLEAHGDFFGASIDKTSYRVQSLIPWITEADLRSAQDEYPDWIKDRYLLLPDSIPSRVFNLAAELTQDDGTAYDKARSLESYLRGFEYTLEVEMPPLDRDMVDYFLFDLQKGYCDYYATSMVVMARSLGIPARLAIGYYRGTYDDVNRRYIVTEADAHSWVEIYFSDIGWVPFEPTAGRSEIERFPLESDIPEGLDTVTPLGSSWSWFGDYQWNWTSIAFTSGIGILIIVLAFSTFDNLRILRLSTTGAISHLYRRLYRHGRGLHAPASKGTTPYEFSHNLQRRIASLSKNTIFESSLYPSVSEIGDLTNIYARMLYSPDMLTVRDRNEVISLWRRLRRRLWIVRLRQIFIKDPSQASNTQIAGD